tara:strand:- start:10 stop:645 length:636 start_codon:yes stop_codon:yes gene_type:complete
MYKLQRNPFDGLENTIIRKLDGVLIPLDEANTDYQRFVNNIYTHGLEIVEGADYVGVTTYTEARAAEYPPLEEQLDKIYHKGINAWKADIKKIKDKYPKTQVGITSIAPIPDWVHTALFEKQKEEYVKASARLNQYELSTGKKGVVGIERSWDGNTNSYIDKNVIGYIIKPLPIILGNERNPVVVRDEQERIAAQEVIRKTPQAVIDSINT